MIQEDHELISADAGHQVGGPDMGPQTLSHLHQQLVTPTMAERVVHQLEIVDIDGNRIDKILVKKNT